MSVLSRDEILKAIKSNDISILPFDDSAIGCASVDLKLGNEFRIFPKESKVIELTEETNYQEHTTKFTLAPGESYVLEPGQLCLGVTEEEIELSKKYCGFLEGRSRFARVGLLIHITSPFMQPGIKSKQVLEIYNASNYSLRLVPGTKICQFIFMELKGTGQYEGSFKENIL